MHARSALFDLYGDHLRSRGGTAPVSALIRILGALGISAAAVRTAISRMVSQGWLVPTDHRITPGYRLTDRAVTRLDAAGARIYRTDPTPWDGHWQVRVLATSASRPHRQRIGTQLRFLGMAPISDSTWVGPHPSSELDRLLEEEDLCVARFVTERIEPAEILIEAFDLAELGASYRSWLEEAAALVAGTDGGEPDQETAFVVRSELLHSWRKFLFSDPGLPEVLLPPDWPGHRAARFFDDHAGRLLPAASRFVDAALAGEDR